MPFVAGGGWCDDMLQQLKPSHATGGPTNPAVVELGGNMPFPKQGDIEVPLLKALAESGGSAEPQDLYPRVAA